LHRDVNHSTLQSSSAINISNTIPVGAAALPFFTILRAFKISYLLINSEGPSSTLPFHRLWHYPMCITHSAFSPYLLHLIIFYQHFSICIFHIIYSYYILPGFCHLLCNPVDILSCLLYSATHHQALALSFPVQEQHFSLHFILPLYTYYDHLLFSFYAIYYSIFFSPQ